MKVGGFGGKTISSLKKSCFPSTPTKKRCPAAYAIPLKGGWATGHLILQILPSGETGVQFRHLQDKTWPNVSSLRSYPTKLLLGAYCGEAYDIRQAWQDLVGTTGHFVPPFFTFHKTPLALPSTLGRLGWGRSTRYCVVKLIRGLKVQNKTSFFCLGYYLFHAAS